MREINQTEFQELSSPILKPIPSYLQKLEQSLSHIWLMGIERIDDKTIEDWQQLSYRGQELGLTYLTEKCNSVLSELKATNSLNESIETILELTVLSVIARSM